MGLFSVRCDWWQRRGLCFLVWQTKMGGDCCKNVLFCLCLLHLLWWSLSLLPPSFSSLQGISLFYKFTTYSNDSDVFDSVAIDNVNSIGTFSNASTYVLTTTSLACTQHSHPKCWLVDDLCTTVYTTAVMHFEFMTPKLAPACWWPCTKETIT